jgi:multicomponent Na+:H+ antiporter subunit D
MEKFLPFFIILPLGGAFLIYLLGSILKNKAKYLYDLLANLILFLIFVLTLLLIRPIKTEAPLLYFMGGHRPPFGITIVVDGLSWLMLLLISGIGFLAGIFAINYLEPFTARYKYWTLFLLLIGGMNGVAITGDIFNLYVFIEISAIASYVLVGFGVRDEELEAAFKYMVIGSIGSLFILLSIALIYARTGTLNMADINHTLNQSPSLVFQSLISILFLVGFGIKAALFPFHFWLPDAHPSAPAPISAMLSGVVVKVLGVYGIMRIFYNVLGILPLVKTTLLILAGLSMLLGVILQLGQTDIKRLLAYCSISQIGYIIMGIAIGTPWAILGSVYHLFNHAVFKSLLFLDAGAVEMITNTRDMRKLGGLAQKLRLTSLGWFVGSFGASGLPPFSGFFSKLILIVAAFEAQYYILGIIAAVSAALTLASFIRTQRQVFLGPEVLELKHIREKGIFTSSSLLILLVITLLGGILLIPAWRSSSIELAQNALLLGKNYAEVIFTKAGIF